MFTKEIKQKFIDSIKKWQVKLNLQDWEIKCVFKDEKSTDGRTAENSINNLIFLSEIIIFRDFFDEQKNYNVERTIKHELCHILTQPLADLIVQNYVSEEEATRIEEQLTQKIAKLIK